MTQRWPLSWSGPLPERFPSPFDDGEPHPVARAAAADLTAQLSSGFIAPGLSTSVLERAEGGKMFGVLVVRDAAGSLSVLRAFSGQLERSWQVPGYAGPLFDVDAWTRLERSIDETVKSLTARVEAARADPQLLKERAERSALRSRLHLERAELRALHAERKRIRRSVREGGIDEAAARALDDESRADDRARRRFEQTARDAEHVPPLERRLSAMERLRRLVSRQAMRLLWDTYEVHSFSGEERSLISFFEGDPPSGAGDCAAPKLLEAAHREGLQPIALAELWWGAPPPGGGKVQGTFFPACREKCGPLLPFQLQGIDVAERRAHRPPERRSVELRTLWEDEHLIIVDKPEGLLSVPARDASIEDSVQARLRERWPLAQPAHRLDLDTSGVLVVAKDAETFAAVQAQFRSREVQKTYLALVEGVVQQDSGVIELPLRLDVDHRPRQMVDEQFGKAALTRWRVLERRERETLIEFEPVTGRTHQLRVHAAHPRGLGHAIVGDRLYGHAGPRLMLHAQRIRLRVPATGEVIVVEAPNTLER